MSTAQRTGRGGPLQAYRRWYSTLHPSLQVIGMQLWMPVFFVIMFCICYVGAFNLVRPHEVPIAVVGQTQALDAAAQKVVPGAFRFLVYDDDAAATGAVLRGAVGAAYDPASRTIFVAGAHQAQAATTLPRLLAPVLTAPGGQPPATKDIAPLPTGDIGMTPMYLMLTWCIGGYMAAMFIGMMGGPLRHWVRMAVIAGLGLVLSLLSVILVDPVLQALTGHFWTLWGLGWAWMVAIGLAVNGLSYFFGRFVALPAMVIFVFLSIPSSGAAFPQWFMPQPFLWLNHVVVGSGITEMLKRLVYGVGPGYGRGWTMMACYAAAGLILAFVGKRLWLRRQARHFLTGKRTMFTDAQQANRDYLGAQRDKFLNRRGLTTTETGTITAIGLRDRGDGAGGPVDNILDSRGLEGDWDADRSAGARGGSEVGSGRQGRHRR